MDTGEAARAWGPSAGDFLRPLEWRWSRFARATTGAKGDWRAFSGSSGRIVTLPQDEAKALGPIRQAGTAKVHLAGPARMLAEAEALVSSDTDEIALAASRFMSFAARQERHLVLFANRRALGKREDMDPSVATAVKRLIDREGSAVTKFTITWLGWRPMLSLAQMLDITTYAQACCRKTGASFTASLRGSGSPLSAESLSALFHAGVKHVDLFWRGGLSTLEDDLKAAGIQECGASVLLRVTSRVSQELRCRLTAIPGVEVTGDGQPNNRSAGTLESSLADGNRLRLAGAARRLLPFGTMCHAADPRTITVGVDGVLHRCTVALKDPANAVGALLPSGDLAWSEAKLARWLEPWALRHNGCHDCCLLPSCYGNACPLYRLSTGRAPCPNDLYSLDSVLASDASGTDSPLPPCAASDGCRSVPKSMTLRRRVRRERIVVVY